MPNSDAPIGSQERPVYRQLLVGCPFLEVHGYILLFASEPAKKKENNPYPYKAESFYFLCGSQANSRLQARLQSIQHPIVVTDSVKSTSTPPEASKQVLDPVLRNVKL